MQCVDGRNGKRKNDANSDIQEAKRCKTVSNVAKNFNDIHLKNDFIPEEFIVCEKQERIFCGRHALRAIAQNTVLFDDQFLQTLGRQLASEELLIRQDIHVEDNQYFNVYTGYYNIQVIQEALKKQ